MVKPRFVELAPHGTFAGWKSWGCRCMWCCAAEEANREPKGPWELPELPAYSALVAEAARSA